MTRDGSAYITDTEEGTVYRLDPKRKRLRRIVKVGALDGANGIALSADERQLYVAHNRGVDLLDLPTGHLRPLPHPPRVTLAGIDGLYQVHDELIAIQEGSRIVAFRLDSRGEAVVSQRILSSRDPKVKGPTTAAVVGDDLYFPANPQLEAFDKEGHLWPSEKREPIRICKVSLLQAVR